MFLTKQNGSSYLKALQKCKLTLENPRITKGELIPHVSVMAVLESYQFDRFLHLSDILISFKTFDYTLSKIGLLFCCEPSYKFKINLI